MALSSFVPTAQDRLAVSFFLKFYFLALPPRMIFHRSLFEDTDDDAQNNNSQIAAILH